MVDLYIINKQVPVVQKTEPLKSLFLTMAVLHYSCITTGTALCYSTTFLLRGSFDPLTFQHVKELHNFKFSHFKF